MQLGMIGLGRMGANIVRRLIARRDILASSTIATRRRARRSPRRARQRSHRSPSWSRRSTPPRAVWVMLPAGAPTESTIETLDGLLRKGDTIIDGGNTFWQDDVRRGQELAERGLKYLDVGTSGGVWGLERGYCLMIGGDKAEVERLDPIFAALAPGRGDIAAHPAATAAIRASNAAISMPAPAAPATSSKWCTTASNTV